MKTKINTILKLHRMRLLHHLSIKNVALIAFMIVGLFSNLKAQDTSFSKPSWWFGVSGAGNFNFYRGSTQNMNADFTSPTAFHDGFGVGLFVAPLIEYHKPNSRWGVMFQAGYDNRSGSWNQVVSPCNCPADLKTDLSYITIEPSLRFAPFKSNLYLYAGPRLAFNINKAFTYQLGKNPEILNQAENPPVKGDFSNIETMLMSMQIGAGYDINLSADNKRTQWVFSPFVAYHPYFGESPRSMETWNITTLRVGATIKFGVGKKTVSTTKDTSITKKNTQVDAKTEEVLFIITSPKNIPDNRNVRETFPLRNYVFFDSGSTQLSYRYVLLKKGQGKNFDTEKLALNKPDDLSGRSERQMSIYYNILNILGDRMVKNPSTKINLVGSSENDPANGLAMANSVKTYLVNTFGIDANRINVEGRSKPKIPSKQAGATLELALLNEGDRRVSIESVSQELLMEFQSGPNAPLKPIEFVNVQEAPLDSYLSFDVDAKKYESWSLEVKDKEGKIQYFGPYTQDKVSIPGKTILGTKHQADYSVTMLGKTKNGTTIKKEVPVHMALWTPSTTSEGMRYSVIFEFNESKTTAAYKKYLNDIIVPKIKSGSKIIIHGYTDIIGSEEHNLKLSTARSNDVKNILEKGLKKANTKDIKFEVLGFGEDQNLSPFQNTYPEERFYNRTVVIDIIPAE